MYFLHLPNYLPQHCNIKYSNCVDVHRSIFQYKSRKFARLVEPSRKFRFGACTPPGLSSESRPRANNAAKVDRVEGGMQGRRVIFSCSWARARFPGDEINSCRVISVKTGFTGPTFVVAPTAKPSISRAPFRHREDSRAYRRRVCGIGSISDGNGGRLEEKRRERRMKKNCEGRGGKRNFGASRGQRS